MKISELRQKSLTELRKSLLENRRKLGQLRFDLSAGKVKDIRGIRKTKKEIVQILTLLAEDARKQESDVKDIKK